MRKPRSECNSFSFLSPDHLQQLAGRELASEALFFWREINQLLIFIIRTASRAVLSLIEGVVTAIQTHNELLLSLVARAFVEHACSLDHLASTVDHGRPRLLEEVWPAYTADRAAERIRPTDDDRKLQEALLRYAVGRRVQLGEVDPPAAEDSRGRWEDYLKSLRDVPAHLVPETVLKSIDKTSSKNGYQWVRMIYEQLCEYCHPNSESRSLDYIVKLDDLGKHAAQEFSRRELPPGFLKVWALLRSSLPPLCRKVEEGLSLLSSCRLPMGKQEGSMRTAGPPIGSVACVDQHGRSIYVDLDRLDIEWEIKTELTLARIRRIEALQNIFGDVVPGPMSEWLNNFRYEIPVNAEDELRLWERLGRVYQDELGDRPGMPPDERRFLADAILARFTHELRTVHCG